MLIHVRSIAASFAVLSFFVLSIVGLFYGLSPYTCCKRACVGAALAYIAASLAVKVVNAVLIRAIIESHTSKRKETESVG